MNFLSLFLTRHSGVYQTLAVYFLGAGFASAVVVLLYLLGFDAVSAVRDRAMGNSPVAGLISDIGIILVAAAGILALLRSRSLTDARLGMLGLFCCLFALDDGLQLHERLGDLEVLAFAVYGVFFLTLLFSYSKVNARLAWPLVITLAAFAASVLIDTFWNVLVTGSEVDTGFLYRLGFVLEDIPKFGGIFVLASFVVGEVLLSNRERQSM